MTKSEISFDVFLSYSSADRARVRRLAESLRRKGLRVWFDEWAIGLGDDIYLAVERGLASSRLLVLCLSPAALGSEWINLERSTVLFRDPSNTHHRFIPLLLADCDLPDTLRRYKYVDFRQDSDAAFKELLTACGYSTNGPADSADLSLDVILPPARCFGREVEIAALIATLIVPKPVATVVLGTPGIGKTTLTRKVAASSHLVEHFGDRRWFVKLDVATNDAALRTAIAAAIGLEPASASFEVTIARLHRAPGLLILDNLETPWESEPEAVEETLQHIAVLPGMALLASMRGHEVPRHIPWTSRQTLEALNESDARRLFRDIAPRIRSDDPHLPSFLRALANIPLAIELVAHRAESHSDLEELWDEWQHLGVALAQRPGVDLNRLTSLSHSIELSLCSRRLRPAGRRLFCFLGQLPAGMARAEREVLLGEDARQSVEQLCGIGLAVIRDNRADLLPPIRDHARRNHRPEGDDATHWWKLYLDLAATFGPSVAAVGGDKAVDRLLPEMPNIEASMHAATELALTDCNAMAKALSAVHGLGQTMRFTGSGSPDDIAGLARACHETADRGGEGRCAQVMGDIALARSDYTNARANYERALPLLNHADEMLGVAWCIKRLGNVELACSDRESASARYEQALTLFHHMKNVRGEASCIRSLGDIALARSDHVVARARYNDALPLYRQVAAKRGEAICHERLGDIALAHADHSVAGTCYELALSLFRQVGDMFGEATSLRSIGDLAEARNDRNAARARILEALAIFERYGDAKNIVATRDRLARLTIGSEHTRRA